MAIYLLLTLLFSIAFSSHLHYLGQLGDINETFEAVHMHQSVDRNPSRTASKPMIVSPSTALINVNEYKHGDIVKIFNLKQQRNVTLQQIVKLMNNSYGIVMENAVRKRNNKTEIRLEWIVNRQTKIGIRLKYLKHSSFQNIYIHDVSELNFDQRSALVQMLLFDDKKDIFYSSYHIPVGGQSNILYDGLVYFLVSYDQLMLKPTIVEFIQLFPILRDDVFVAIIEKIKICSPTNIKPHLKRKLIAKLQTLRDVLHLHHLEYSQTNYSKNTANITLCNYVKQYFAERTNIVINTMRDMFNERKVKEYQSVWGVFKEIVIQTSNAKIIEMARGYRVKKGTTLTLEIINSYLLKSYPNRHDLHVIVDDKEWLGHPPTYYDELVNGLAANLDQFQSYNVLLAKSIIKMVMWPSNQTFKLEL